MKKIVSKLFKALRLIKSRKYISCVFHKVIPSVEHEKILNNISNLSTIVDIGANKGQFAAISRIIFPISQIYSFEPLERPAKIFVNAFKNDKLTSFFNYAIGQSSKKVPMHISKKEDSSSILPISSLQSSYFPGTEEEQQKEIEVRPLDTLITVKELVKPVLLKIDVQGYELEVLKGCKSLLNSFNYIYVECSFVELYEGQALSHQVIEYLQCKNFYLTGVFNVFYDKKGKAIQGDFMFEKLVK